MTSEQVKKFVQELKHERLLEQSRALLEAGRLQMLLKKASVLRMAGTRKG